MTLGETRLLYHEIIVIAFYANVIAREIFRENKDRGSKKKADSTDSYQISFYSHFYVSRFYPNVIVKSYKKES